ncbi:MAG: hypothetical protein K8R52_07895 [Bacteroidales bacterium]|nr:hypothetical protein [Bacteroidales bacterium]
MKKALYQQPRLFVIGLVTTTLILFSGCNYTQKKQDKETPAAEEQATKEAVVEELSGYPIPTSYEITKLIYQSGAPYILSLSNGPEKAEEYITQRDKVLNLGVYATDLCYATTYMMKQGTMNYLEASKILIDDLGISTTFNITYAERIESNIDDRDSLIQIVSESFGDTWNYLVENEQDVLARLVVSGSWIEGVYITTNVALKASDNTAFLEALAKQKNSLNKLVDLLEPVKDVEEVTELYKGLFDLQVFYEGVGDIMTDEQLKIVSETIEALRGSIV